MRIFVEEIGVEVELDYVPEVISSGNSLGQKSLPDEPEEFEILSVDIVDAEKLIEFFIEECSESFLEKARTIFQEQKNLREEEQWEQ